MMLHAHGSSIINVKETENAVGVLPLKASFVITVQWMVPLLLLRKHLWQLLLVRTSMSINRVAKILHQVSVVGCVRVLNQRPQDARLGISILRLLGRGHAELANLLWPHILKTHRVFTDGLILIKRALQSPIRVKHIKLLLELPLLLHILHLFDQDQLTLFLCLFLGALVEVLSIRDGLCSHLLKSVQELLLIEALGILIHILSQVSLLDIFFPLLSGLFIDDVSIYGNQTVMIVVGLLLLHHLVLQVLLQLLVLSLLLNLVRLGLQFVVAGIFVDDGAPELVVCLVSYGAKESSNLW